MASHSDGESRWFWSGYLDWSEELAKNRTIADAPQQQKYVPVFLRLKHEERGVEYAFELFDQEEGELRVFQARFEPHEMEYAKLTSHEAVEFFVYVVLRRLEEDESRSLLEEFFLILDVGSAIVLGDKFSARDFSIPPNALTIPLVAAIDDGIAFLNERFTRYDPNSSTLKTRFVGVWVQARERAAPGGSSVVLGRTLDANEINLFLAQGSTLSELETYQTLNAELFGPTSRRSTEYAFSHGTHVLDVAAGADPYSSSESVDQWPLLAVQLPPESIEDTSGRRFETHVVMGLRWILAVAAPRAFPLVVNISLGILAGPKNGTKFFEYQTAREVLRWRNFTRQHVRVVFAFGNSLRTRQVARYCALPPNSPESIEWTVQPDDLTPSFIETHLNQGNEIPSTFAMGLIAPDGTAINPLSIAPGSHVTMFDPSGTRPVARIYHVPSRFLGPAPVGSGTLRTPANYTIAIAPTATREIGELVSPSGNWKVTLRHGEAQALDAILQIQTDDTAPGYEPLGRQSYFDDKDAHAWDPETLDFGALLPNCPISRDGTNNALATGRVQDSDGNELVLSAGGAVWVSKEEPPRPALYASKGSDWSGGPTNGAISEDGYALQGVLASGTLSGSVQELVGTSSAAPKIARRLARELTGSARPHAPGDTHLAIIDSGDIMQLSGEVLIERAGARAR